MAILGIDEVGRGPWAGPLVVGAAILPDDHPSWVDDLKDSKKLTPKQRLHLSEVILAEATATGLGWVSASEIDQIGLTASLRLATRRALKSMQHQNAKFSQIIIDGNQNFLADTPFASRTSVLIKADNLIKEVSAASIIAKVARDHYMCEIAELYPEYGFAQHKGYGTAKHSQALQKFGPCREHRLSFKPIRERLGLGDPTSIPNSPTTTMLGTQGEMAVADWLETRGHTIVMRNYRTKICEIDIISIYQGKLYFTEVKYRKNRSRGGGLAAVTPTKKQKMIFATQVFLKNHPEFQQFQPLLAVADVTGPDFEITEFITLTE